LVSEDEKLRSSKLTSHDIASRGNGQLDRISRAVLMGNHLYIEKQTTVRTKLRKIRIIEVRECDLGFQKMARGSPQICAQCAGNSMMMTADSAARISAIGIDAINELVELGEVHSTDGEAGLLVCLNSIVECATKEVN
jgi:hypothetical protein